MKYPFILLITSFLTLWNLSFGQVEYAQVFDNVFVKEIKVNKAHILIHYNDVSDGQLKPYIVNGKQSKYGEGFAVMNSKFQYEWIYAIEKGHITDFYEDANHFYILQSIRFNSKISSTAQLFLIKLNRKGKLLSRKKIDERYFKVPNGQFDAKFDKNGLIWKITIDPFHPNLKCEVYTIEALNFKLEPKDSVQLFGSHMRLKAYDTKIGESAFVFNSDSICGTNNSIAKDSAFTTNGSSNLLLLFNAKGQLISEKFLTSGFASVDAVKYQGEQLILTGTYEGNDSLDVSTASYFYNTPLRSFLSFNRKSLATNSFVASLGSNLQLNWINFISGTCDIKLNSLSTSPTEIAVSFDYKDSVVVAEKSFYSLKDVNEYQYSDHIICFFDGAGKLTTHQQLACYSSSWNEFYIFPNVTAIYGSFLYDINVFDTPLHSTSKNSVYYLKLMNLNTN